MSLEDNIQRLLERQSETVGLLRALLEKQTEQNALLNSFVQNQSAQMKQRQDELANWKQANPLLARKCAQAAEQAGLLQSTFIEKVADEIIDITQGVNDFEAGFVINEFIDAYGVRLAHVNGILQVLSQLGHK